MADIIGDDEDNVLQGTTDSDTFDGKGGSDIFVVRNDSGFNTYFDTGTDGTDAIVAFGQTVSIGLTNSFTPENGIEVISSGGNPVVFIDGAFTNDLFDFSQTELIGIRKIEMGPGRDTVIGTENGENIRGNNGNDSLEGGGGRDLLQGGSRNDWDPVADAGHLDDGNDILIGGRGRDAMAGGANDDILRGGQGADLLYGGSGNDTLEGGGLPDTFLYRDIGEGGDLILDFSQFRDKIDMVAIDADESTEENDAFLFAGQVEGAAVANSVSYEIIDGSTMVRADVTGDTVADFEIELVGEMRLTRLDFDFTDNGLIPF